MKRVIFTLSPQENRKRRRLKPQPGAAFSFWKDKAQELGLDHRTIMMGDEEHYSGLPLGHNRHWCYPYDLICKERPEYTEDEDDLSDV